MLIKRSSYCFLLSQFAVSFKGKRYFMRCYLICILLSVVAVTKGQKISRSEYIATYSKLAQDEMRRSGIPASITLAQGLLESGDGNSRLAVKANNHFGIKCHDWKGATIYHNDDKDNECFRKYKSPEESFRDHSDFLTTKTRYAKLFELKPDDYKGWAHGLKEAGYATSPTYAKALIKIIEENELHKFDEQVLSGSKKPVKHREKRDGSATTGKERTILYNNRVKYILADSGDTYSSLTKELNLLPWQLSRYNEKETTINLVKDEIVYLQPKRSKADARHKHHTVIEGETMYSISQKYAVKEQSLREKNNIPAGQEPKAGVVLLLRKKVNATEPVKSVTEIKQQPKEEKVKEPKEEKKKTPQEIPDEFQIDIDLGD